MSDVLRCRFVGVTWLALLGAVALIVLFPAPARAASDVVISQVYGGGGNTGATYTNDYIELFNRGDTAQDLTGWTVFYASATGTFSTNTTARTQIASGTIQPGGYFLIQEVAGAGGSQPLPTPDATGSIAMSGTTGKVALMTSLTVPTCSPVNYVDLIGWGSTASCYEGTGRAPVLTNTTANLRKGDGCTDTDDNAADFSAATAYPNARNSASPKNYCYVSCPASLTLNQNYWEMISLPCDPGSNNEVQDVFTDLGTGVYGSEWIVWRRDEGGTPPSYVAMGLTDTLSMGTGYWIRNMDAAPTTFNMPAGSTVYAGGDIGLTGVLDADGCGNSYGQCNLVGNPWNYRACWPDVQVVDGGSPISLSAADPSGICQTTGGANCILARVGYKRNSAGGYDSFDSVTTGMIGTLMPWDAIWVSANKAGIALRFPSSMQDCGTPRAGTQAGEWYLRLVAESGSLRDSGRVFGQLHDSTRGYDAHDLAQMAPFSGSYLSVVFPHTDWGTFAGNYDSDFHAITSPRQVDSWTFEVRSGTPDVGVTLGWEEAPADILARSTLVDLATGERVQPTEGGKYAFTLAGTSRAFKWELAPSRPAQAAPPNIDIDMAPVRPVRAADPNVSIDR